MLTKLMAKFNLKNLNYLFDWLAFTNFYIYFLSYNLIFKQYNLTTSVPLSKDNGYTPTTYINNGLRSILMQSNKE